MIKNSLMTAAIALGALVAIPSMVEAYNGTGEKGYGTNHNGTEYQNRHRKGHLRGRHLRRRGHHSHQDAHGVPELDPSTSGAGLTLLVGGTLIVLGRRRRVSA